MAGRPPADPELVEEALRRVDAGEHRDDVAAALTAQGRPISARTIRRAQSARKATGEATGGHKASRVARGPDRAAKRQPAARVLPPPPAPIPLLSDALAELRAAAEQTKGQLLALAGKQGYSAAGNLLDKLLKSIAAVERERAEPGKELSHLLGKGAAAVAKIRQGAAVVARREADCGRCARCGRALSDEQREAAKERAA